MQRPAGRNEEVTSCLLPLNNEINPIGPLTGRSGRRPVQIDRDRFAWRDEELVSRLPFREGQRLIILVTNPAIFYGHTVHVDCEGGPHLSMKTAGSVSRISEMQRDYLLSNRQAGKGEGSVDQVRITRRGLDGVSRHGLPHTGGS